MTQAECNCVEIQDEGKGRWDDSACEKHCPCTGCNRRRSGQDYKYYYAGVVSAVDIHQ